MNPARSAALTARPAGKDPIQEALQLRAKGQPREALEALSAAGEFSTDFYVLRGDLQLELGQVKEAAGSYFTVTASEPDNIYAQRNLGLCLRRLARWEAAAEALHAVLKFDPHRDEVRLELGDCLLHLKRFEEALSCLDQCWSDGSRRRALFGRAVALQQLRRFDEAETFYERVLILDPRAGEALSNLIAISLEVFDLNRVQQYSRRLLDLDPQSAAALKGLTLVAIERREYERAADYFFRAGELEPELMRPAVRAGAVEKSGAVEYRMHRKAFDALVETRNNQPAKVARAASGGY
jgi:tetratricopeptide (TPR) repeat protein